MVPRVQCASEMAAMLGPCNRSEVPVVLDYGRSADVTIKISSELSFVNGAARYLFSSIGDMTTNKSASAGEKCKLACLGLKGPRRR